MIHRWAGAAVSAGASAMCSAAGGNAALPAGDGAMYSTLGAGAAVTAGAGEMHTLQGSLDALHHRRRCCSRSRGWCDVSTNDAVAAIMGCDALRQWRTCCDHCKSWCSGHHHWRKRCDHCRSCSAGTGAMNSTTGARAADTGGVVRCAPPLVHVRRR